MFAILNRPKKVHKTYLGDIGVLIGSHKVQVSCNRGGEHIILLDDKPLERGVARTLPDENNALILRDNSDKVGSSAMFTASQNFTDSKPMN